MGIGWSTGEYVPVNLIRNIVGWTGNGSTSFFDLKTVLDHYNVSYRLAQVQSKDELFQMLDRGSIIGFVYNSGGISRTKDNPQYDLVGKYYQDATGHYSIIKGYTKDKKYLVIYDPLPSDWINNGLRYGDGISMIGRNRFYLIDQVYRSMSTGMVIEFTR